MRPIHKGLCPTTNTGQDRDFRQWNRAIRFLVNKTGAFCHICERKVTNNLAIEHIVSRDEDSNLSADWNNFLLICSSCNSSKGCKLVQNIRPYNEQYIWPHLNNTLLAFEVNLLKGIISPSNLLNIIYLNRANNTINLYELSKVTTADGSVYKPLLYRLEAMVNAIDRLIEYTRGECTIPSIIDHANNCGYFTVWISVFSRFPDVQEALLRDARLFDQNLLPLIWSEQMGELALVNRSANDV